MPPLCARCGSPVAWPVDRCRECAGRRIAYESARSAVAYEGPATRLVGAWKEGGRRRLARIAADVTADVVSRPPAEALTYVPAVAERALWRGHNPAAVLAEELAARWSIPAVALLARTAPRGPQRGLPFPDRRRNVRGAFVARSRPPPFVILVDDVYTTGSTVAEAASVLRQAGARRVDVVTFARALRGRGGSAPVS